MAAKDYTSAALIKAEMVDIPAADWGTSYDSLMADLATRVSRYIDGVLHRPAGAFAVKLADESDVTRYYPGGARRLFLREEWLQVTSISIADTMTGDYTALGLPSDSSPDLLYLDHGLRVMAAPASCRPLVAIQFTENQYTPADIPNAIQVVGIQGYATGDAAAPGWAPIEQAATALAIRWWKRAQSAWADGVGSPSQGDMGPLAFAKAMDAEIREMLDTVPKLMVRA